MKVGDLVRFKVHHYDKSYGIGIVYRGVGTSGWAFFAGECLMVRAAEVKVVSEGR